MPGPELAPRRASSARPILPGHRSWHLAAGQFGPTRGASPSVRPLALVLPRAHGTEGFPARSLGMRRQQTVLGHSRSGSGVPLGMPTTASPHTAPETPQLTQEDAEAGPCGLDGCF